MSKPRTPVYCSHARKRVNFIDDECWLCGELWQEVMPSVVIGYIDND